MTGWFQAFVDKVKENIKKLIEKMKGKAESLAGPVKEKEGIEKQRGGSMLTGFKSAFLGVAGVIAISFVIIGFLVLPPFFDRAGDQNHRPEITGFYPTEHVDISIGESQEFNVSVRDQDNDSLVILWYLNHAVVETNMTSFLLIATQQMMGPNELNVTVRDLEYSTSLVWNVTVV